MSVSGSDDSDSGLPASTDPVPAAMRPKPSRGKRPICPRCHKGFHIQRNLHVKCSICQTLFHRRCIRKADSFDGADSLVCQKCDRPSTRSRAEQGIPSACARFKKHSCLKCFLYKYSFLKLLRSNKKSRVKVLRLQGMHA